MKILWVNTNFLHPTTKGGQIRSLGMLRWLHRWHEIHYVAIQDPRYPEGPRLAAEYSSRAYAFPYAVPSKRSAAFYAELARGLFSATPVAVGRFNPPGMAEFLADIIRKERFDRAVVDHLAPSSYFPALERSILFQHNVETIIWRRHAEHAKTVLHKLYFQDQARRMYNFERRVSRAAGHIVAVSQADADAMRSLLDVKHVTPIATGVDLDYFAPPAEPQPREDIVFVGSMDWLANVDGVMYFAQRVFPLIQKQQPDCTFAVVGRDPPPEIMRLASGNPAIRVTGTVSDIRPHLWGAKMSIVPLRIGGGTRLKIFESMAAGTAVVSTSVGAEGLELKHPHDIRLADTEAALAQECLDLLANPQERRRLANAALDLVSARYSWETVSREFESILERGPGFGASGIHTS